MFVPDNAHTSSHLILSNGLWIGCYFQSLLINELLSQKISNFPLVLQLGSPVPISLARKPDLLTLVFALAVFNVVFKE